MSQYTALSIMGNNEGLSNAQLARRTYVSPQAMNQLLEQLESAGLILRLKHESNARIRPIALTEQGRDILLQCDAAVDQLEEEMLHSVNPEERVALTQRLVDCVRTLGGGF